MFSRAPVSGVKRDDGPWGRRQRGKVRAAAASAVILIMSTGCAATQRVDGGESALESPTRTTTVTQIAGAEILGYDRSPDEACASVAATADPGGRSRWVANSAGVADRGVEVPAEAHRIVALSGSHLDALCALGLQGRLVAAALPEGSRAQPAYLGTTVHDLPGVGSRDAPDLDAIAAAQPDLILGSEELTPGLYPALARIAPTVFTAGSGPAWADALRQVGAATARSAAVDDLLNGFARQVTRTAEQSDTAHFQVSVVELTDTTLRIYGPASFSGAVLQAAGVDRPPSQRFTDRAYVELQATDADLRGRADFAAADGDIVYLSFASPEAKARAAALLDGSAWRRLGANRDHRVFVVDHGIWHGGQGMIAARAILEDLDGVDAPLN